MIRTSAAGFLLALSLAAQTPIAPAKKVKLFNGRSLDGWYTYLRENKYEDPKRVFRVERGKLVTTGEEWGRLGTKEA